jgi:DNA primase
MRACNTVNGLGNANELILVKTINVNFNVSNAVIMNIWEEVKSKLDIVDIIGEYIPVLTAGNGYRASSPFKKEKTPSLMISQQKQIWHDFSTGKGGDIFGFVMELENITRAEALRKLASKAGVKLTAQAPQTQQTVEQKTLHEAGLSAIEWTVELYHKVLLSVLKNREHPVTQYCIERRLTPKLIEQFKIGLAPTQNFLLNLLLKNKKDTALFETLELIVNRNDTLKDKFVDRLMIPITNTEGKYVGFTGRVLPYDKNVDRPKYLNSAQSEWFDKSKVWFGLSLARKAILIEKKAIVVEGNMDVIAAFGGGFEYTVASQGTSFTTSQLSLLARFTKKIWLAFDNDSAGILAAQKLFMTATPLGFVIEQIVIPTEFKDLDEYLGSLKTDETLETQHFIERWIILNTPRLTSPDSSEQKQAIQDACTLISVTDDITTEQYLAKINAITGISINTLLKQTKLSASKLPIMGESNTEMDIALPSKSPVAIIKENLLIIWQKIAATTSLVKENKFSTVISVLYFLIKELEVVSQETEAEYTAEHSDELAMIIEETKLVYQDQSIKSLLHSAEKQLDSGISTLFSEPELMEQYYQLKQLLQQI